MVDKAAIHVVANLTVALLYVLCLSLSLSLSLSFSLPSLSLVSLNSSLCFAPALPLNNKARILNLCWVIFMRLFSPPPLGALAWSALLCHWRPLSTPDYVCFCCDRRDITNCHHKLNATSRLCRHSQPTSQAGRRTHGRGQSETKSATSASLSPPLVCVMALAST